MSEWKNNSECLLVGFPVPGCGGRGWCSSVHLSALQHASVFGAVRREGGQSERGQCVCAWKQTRRDRLLFVKDVGGEGVRRQGAFSLFSRSLGSDGVLAQECVCVFGYGAGSQNKTIPYLSENKKKLHLLFTGLHTKPFISAHFRNPSFVFGYFQMNRRIFLSQHCHMKFCFLSRH